jgi:hypothetical protein
MVDGNKNFGVYGGDAIVGLSREQTKVSGVFGW